MTTPESTQLPNISPQTYGLDPTSVNLNDPNLTRSIYCYLQNAGNQYDGNLGVRISSVFVILIVSSAVTFFPVLATKVPRLRIPLYVYLFARYFGSGVIVATAFVHLLDPAYAEIGPNTCVGQTAGWVLYSWPPAISMATAVLTFLLDFAAARYVEKKYGIGGEETYDPTRSQSTARAGSVDAAMLRYSFSRRRPADGHTHFPDAIENQQDARRRSQENKDSDVVANTDSEDSLYDEKERAAEVGFQQQIAAFLILEFGVLFHSVIIGLTLGSAGKEFSILYPVIVFHQSFEGLGIGARLSAIPFPRRLHWMPWVLCAGYGLTTPIAIAAGLGVRTTYNQTGFTANVVSGLLDSISSGILVYTGLVELLARDFLFNPDRTNDDKQLTFMAVSVLLGAGLMALLGKWA